MTKADEICGEFKKKFWNMLYKGADMLRKWPNMARKQMNMMKRMYWQLLILSILWNIG